MIFFYNANGELLRAFPTNVYQGSVNASELYIIAPLSEKLTADVLFTLPNGEITAPFILTKAGDVPIDIPDGLSVWYTSLSKYVTQYFGNLKMQVRFYLSNGAILTTTEIGIEIQKGIVQELPEEPTADAWERLMSYISETMQDVSQLIGLKDAPNLKSISTIGTDGIDYKTFSTATYKDGSSESIDTERLLPIRAGNYIKFYQPMADGTVYIGLTDEATKNINLNLENGTGEESLQGTAQCSASALASVALGMNTIVAGEASFGAGYEVNVSGWYSAGFGVGTISGNNNQLVCGQYNDNEPNSTLFEVGNGNNENARNNAFIVLLDGRAKVDGTPTEDDDVVRKKELDSKLNKPATSTELGVVVLDPTTDITFTIPQRFFQMLPSEDTIKNVTSSDKIIFYKVGDTTPYYTNVNNLLSSCAGLNRSNTFVYPQIVLDMIGKEPIWQAEKVSGEKTKYGVNNIKATEKVDTELVEHTINIPTTDGTMAVVPENPTEDSLLTISSTGTVDTIPSNSYILTGKYSDYYAGVVVMDKGATNGSQRRFYCFDKDNMHQSGCIFMSHGRAENGHGRIYVGTASSDKEATTLKQVKELITEHKTYAHDIQFTTNSEDYPNGKVTVYTSSDTVLTTETLKTALHNNTARLYGQYMALGLMTADDNGFTVNGFASTADGMAVKAVVFTISTIATYTPVAI